MRAPEHQIPYPRRAVEPPQMIQGPVRLRIFVSPDAHGVGHPTTVEPVQGHPILVEPAIEYARTWRFDRIKGKTDWFLVTIDFLFNGEFLKPPNSSSRGELVGASACYWYRPNRVEVRGVRYFYTSIADAK